MRKASLLLCLLTVSFLSHAQTMDLVRLQDLLSNRVNSITIEDGLSRQVSSISPNYDPSQWHLSLNVTASKDYWSVKLDIILYQNIIYAGEYYYNNGEYVQTGDTRFVTFKFDRAYLTNSHSLMKDDKPINSCKIGFIDASDAKDFVFLLANAMSSIPTDGWLRQELENEKYADKNSKQMFNLLCKELKAVKITYGDPGSFTSSSFSIKYIHPELIISFVNTPKYPDPWEDRGSYTFYIPLENTAFKMPYSTYDGKLVIRPGDGVRVKHKGLTTTEEDVTFILSKKDCDRILSELRVFKRKILAEGYTGNYYMPSSKTNQSKDQGKTIQGKYVQ